MLIENNKRLLKKYYENNFYNLKLFIELIENENIKNNDIEKYNKYYNFYENYLNFLYDSLIIIENKYKIDLNINSILDIKYYLYKILKLNENKFIFENKQIEINYNNRNEYLIKYFYEIIKLNENENYKRKINYLTINIIRNILEIENIENVFKKLDYIYKCFYE